MNKKIFIPALIVVVLVVVAGFLAARKGSEHPDEKIQAQLSDSSSPEQRSSVATPAEAGPVPAEPVAPTTIPVAEKKTTAHFSSGEEAEGVDVQVFEVIYDGSKFAPDSLSIKAGDVVIFKNKSKSAFWPASNPHPTHTDYPEFDAKKSIAAGQTYEFKFTKVGKWGFHDHINATARGVIAVN